MRFDEIDTSQTFTVHFFLCAHNAEAAKYTYAPASLDVLLPGAAVNNDFVFHVKVV